MIIWIIMNNWSIYLSWVYVEEFDTNKWITIKYVNRHKTSIKIADHIIYYKIRIKIGKKMHLDER
jgi:hypothetical protein